MVAKAKLKAVVQNIEHNGKLDIGCGKNKREGFTGIDQFAMEGVDHVFDLRKEWPVDSDSVNEAHCSHFLEHLTNLNDQWERVHFFNELYRVMKVGAKATIILPHWNSNRYYGDPTHKEPFSEMGFYYLSREWRATQAPHTDKKHNPNGYDCHFAATWGYGMHPTLMARNQEYQQYAMQWYKEAIQDIHATLIKA